MSTKTTKKELTETQDVSIKKPNIHEGIIWIKGNAPLVVHKFSHKAMLQIMEKQAAGTTASSKRKREAKDFEALFNGARHISTDGWDGIPAAAFRQACVSACRLVNFKMTLAKLSIFVKADGWDRDEGTGLVRVIGPKPHQFNSIVRIGSGLTKTTDVSVRARWLPGQWGAKLRICYDADQFTASDIVNLINRAGTQVGVCEGRPDSKSSAGMGWGTFEISTEEEVMSLLPAQEGQE